MDDTSFNHLLSVHQDFYVYVLPVGWLYRVDPKENIQV